jgi:hypothetical protein
MGTDGKTMHLSDDKQGICKQGICNRDAALIQKCAPKLVDACTIFWLKKKLNSKLI